MINIAVLGAGRIGRIHAGNAARLPGARLVAVADPVPSAAAAVADALGCGAHTDPEALLRSGEVDAVVIATPTDTHVALTLAAVREGKAVLCEKPIDLATDRAVAAAAEVARLDGRVMVAFNRRFDPSATGLRAAIDAGEVGAVRQVVISSRDPAPPPLSYIRSSGGIFRDMTIHDFDMARYLLPDEPVSVTAIASGLVDPAIGEAGDHDTVMVMLRTRGGAQCHINNCRQSAYGYDQRMEVFGSNGMVLNDHVRADTVRRYGADRTEARGPLLAFFLERYDEAYRAEMGAFAAALRDGRPMPVTMHDGVQALRLADAALRSAETGRTVEIDTP